MAVMHTFQCATCGDFDEMSEAGDSGVASQPCPSCGELAPQVWRRAPAMRDGNLAHAVKFGGRTILRDTAEEMLSTPDDPDDDSDAFWNEPGFEEGLLDKLERNAALSANGELPPIELDRHSQKVLEDAVTKGQS